MLVALVGHEDSAIAQPKRVPWLIQLLAVGTADLNRRIRGNDPLRGRPCSLCGFDDLSASAVARGHERFIRGRCRAGRGENDANHC
jgi:hypothetical protein